ncbi:hypothetical protein [Actinoplanes sp. NPDC051494]|uniref:hypothetical protein n=1 Tax=Actinoplanes sp. NPDC051494 TaxID=3363907 RepID=UPI0037B8D568
MLTGAVNLGLLLRDREPATALTLIEPSLDALRAAQGQDHPQALAMAQGNRGEGDIEPPPF